MSFCLLEREGKGGKGAVQFGEKKRILCIRGKSRNRSRISLCQKGGRERKGRGPSSLIFIPENRKGGEKKEGFFRSVSRLIVKKEKRDRRGGKCPPSWRAMTRKEGEGGGVGW